MPPVGHRHPDPPLRRPHGGTAARIRDTRKTTPGLRALEKAAVRSGGGVNHRGNLSDGLLLKDNHLAGATIAEAVAESRRQWPGRMIQVECDTVDQLEQALAAGADLVLLDNMSPDEVQACVDLVDHRCLVEVSGGVTLDTVAAYAATGADLIAIGALTHSAPILDIGLDIVDAPGGAPSPPSSPKRGPSPAGAVVDAPAAPPRPPRRAGPQPRRRSFDAPAGPPPRPRRSGPQPRRRSRPSTPATPTRSSACSRATSWSTTGGSPPTPSRTSDEHALLLGQFLGQHGADFDTVTGLVVSSTVPRLTAVLRTLAERYLRVTPVVLEPGTRSGIPILYDNPRQVGPDRIANAVAAWDRYGGPTIMVDFGTATTVDAISAKGEYLGGAILPGIEISLDALFARAAALSWVELVKPRRVIGKTTAESVQSGVLYGFASAVDGLVTPLPGRARPVHGGVHRWAGRAADPAHHHHRPPRAVVNPSWPPPHPRYEHGVSTPAGPAGPAGAQRRPSRRALEGRRAQRPGDST